MIGNGTQSRWNTRASAQGLTGVALAWSAPICAVMLAVILFTAMPAHGQQARTFDIALRNGAVTSSKSVRVTRGDNVVLRWSSDQPLELHMHGYDVTVKVGPEKPAEMKIHARATGRFPVEIHGYRGTGGHGHSTIFHLEVYPD